MERRVSDTFDEATLLAYVEQTMPEPERAAFESRVAGDGRLLASLRRMQGDREALRGLEDETAPRGLAADVLAGVERSMLLETDLVAPPIDMRRYRATHWQRYAAAAGFALLITGGGFMLFQTLRFDSGDEVFAPNHLAQGEPGAPAPAAIDPAPGHADEAGNGPGPAEALTAPVEIAGSEHAGGALAAFEAALPGAAVEPEVIAALERQWPAELDLRANVVSTDPATAFETLASRLRARGGDLIVNSTLNVPGVPTRNPGSGVEPLAGVDRSGQPAPAHVGAIPAPLPVNTGSVLVAHPDDRVPLVDQSRYAAAGYQFTLLGTPSDILSVLRELSADRSLRISWSRRGAGGLLVDLVAPNLPPNTQWDRVMFWWVDPAARFDEARSVVAQVSTEPFVRIPVRILASERR